MNDVLHNSDMNDKKSFTTINDRSIILHYTYTTPILYYATSVLTLVIIAFGQATLNSVKESSSIFNTRPLYFYCNGQGSGVSRDASPRLLLENESSIQKQK